MKSHNEKRNRLQVSLPDCCPGGEMADTADLSPAATTACEFDSRPGHHGLVVEQADTLDSSPSALGRPGSIPGEATKRRRRPGF